MSQANVVPNQDSLFSLTSLNGDFLSLSTKDNIEGSLYFEFTKLINDLNLQILKAESNGTPKERIKMSISGIRDILSSSVYVSRMQSWPRGYQGDFETVEHINSGMEACAFSSLDACIEYYSQTLPISQQHRNKLIYQERLARRAIAENKNILSIGCGGAIDISNALDGVTDYSGVITFIDMDSDALDLARERTSSYQFNFLNKNIVRGVGREKDDFYDLVICGGLFDYLDDRVAGTLLQQIEKKLNFEGTIFLSNICQHNPFRIQMEYMADWELIERTEHEVETLLITNFDQPLNINFTRDATGLAILCTASLVTPR